MSIAQTPIRAFFAIDLPDSTKFSIERIMRDLQPHYPANAVRWVRPQSLHITLQFLKQIRYSELNQLIQLAVPTLQTLDPFEITLGPVQFFPTPKRPHLIALNTEPQPVLQQVSKMLGRCLAEINIPPETRLFRGHITLGRFNFNSTESRSLPDVPMTASLTVKPREIILFQSHPQPNESHYVPLHHFPIGKPT
jgi:2'-5' RNA ligase